MNYQLVYAIDYDRTWKVMSLSSSKSLGYTCHVYSFLPSPFYNDSLGFIVETHNSACRVLCYNMNLTVIDSSVNPQLVYLQLAEIQSYPTGAQPSNYTHASIILYGQALETARHKWQQLIMPQWIQPYVLVAEQDWVATNILMQQLAIAEQHAAYQTYIAEQFALQAAHTSNLALHLLRVTNQAQLPSASERRESVFSPLTASSTSFDDDYSSTDASSIASPRIDTVTQKDLNISKITKEMRYQARLAQQRIANSDLANILQKNHDRMHHLLVFLSNNDYIRSLTHTEVAACLKQANLPISDCILILHKKHAKLSPKVLKALFHVFLEYSDLDYQKQELPQGLINTAHHVFTNKHDSKPFEDESTYKVIKQLVFKYATKIAIHQSHQKPDSIPEPIVTAYKISVQDSKVSSKETVVKPLKPATLLKKIFADYDADEFNTFISNTNQLKQLNAQILELLSSVINDSINNTKAIEFLKKINLNCNACVYLLNDFIRKNDLIVQVLLEKIQSFSPTDYYYFSQEAMRCNKFRVLMQDLKRNNRAQFDTLQQSFADSSAFTLEHLTQLLKINKSGAREELIKYNSIFNLSNEENQTLLMVALQNKAVAPELVTYLIDNSRSAILKRDSTQQTVLHYWAKFRPTNVELFEVLYKAYANAREVELGSIPRSSHDMNKIVDYCKDAEGYSFMHLLLRNESINVGVLIDVIIILILHTGNSLTQLSLIAKSPDGENPYNLIEKRGETFIDAIAHLTEEIASYLEYAADLANPCEFLGTDFTDIFNLKLETNNISKLTPKITESKYYARLRYIVESRMELRGNIEESGRKNLKPILGEHDLKDSIYQLYATGGDKNLKIAELLLTLCIQCESISSSPNILFYLIRDMTNKSVSSEIGLQIMRSIIKLAKESEFTAMLNYTIEQEGNPGIKQEIHNILANITLDQSGNSKRLNL